VESAALLHDLDKALPATHPLRALGHGHAGARWLIERGEGELAPAVEWHPVGRLTDPAYERWIGHASVEELIVAYADKRAIQRLGPLDRRFDRWLREHPDMEVSLRLARSRAGALEAEVCGLAGLAPGEVGRLRWVRRAVAQATHHRAA
jgi:hypothetical protein